MKTKKSFRKKALLSSVAMLLVAAVAVGSATFAWFTQSMSAKADGIFIKVMRGSSLLLSNVKNPQNTDWKPNLKYEDAGTDVKNLELFPASSANGTNWFHTHSSSEDSGAWTYNDGKNEITEFQVDDDAGQHVYHSMLNVKNGGSGTDVKAFEGVKIECNNPSALGDYGRIALVPCSASGVNKGGADAFDKKVFAYNDATPYQAINNKELTAEHTLQTTQITPTSLSASNKTVANIGTLEADTPQYFNLYIWFEGQDKECKEANFPRTIIDLNFTVSATGFAS